MNSEQQIEVIEKNCTPYITKTDRDRSNCPVVWARCDSVIPLLKFLKETDTLGFEFLADLTCYDDFETELEPEGRFVVVYNLYSPQHHLRLRVKTRVGEEQSVKTATVLWASANWAEREVYDMFGVRFEGHPDLRRILMDQRWRGHPLRKDYPLRQYQLFVDPEVIPEDLLK